MNLFLTIWLYAVQSKVILKIFFDVHIFVGDQHLADLCHTFPRMTELCCSKPFDKRNVVAGRDIPSRILRRFFTIFYSCTLPSA